MAERLQKVLADAGVASRRACEAIIASGRVAVNGTVVTEPGTKADPEIDEIRLDGEVLRKPADRTYIVLNKPEGYVTTMADPHAAHMVMELIANVGTRVYPVGRLDADTAGLLLFTNDGAFAQQLTHPSHQVHKTYRVLVRGEMPAHAAVDLREGILLEDGMTAPADAEWVSYDAEHNVTVVDITIHEGRNRQVRRMLDAVGYPALALTRTRIGPIALQGLAPGTWRRLHAEEVQALRDAADSTPPLLPRTPEPDAAEPTEPTASPEPRGRAKGKKIKQARAAEPVDPPATPHERALRDAAERLNRELDGPDDGRPEPPRTASQPPAPPAAAGKPPERAPGQHGQRPGPPRGPRPGGDRPPYPPRGDRPYGDQRPGPPRGPRPGGDRPPYPSRGDRPYGDQRPGPPRGPRPGGDRPPYPPRGDRPYGDQRPGPPRGPRPGSDRPPYPPRGDRPHGDQRPGPSRGPRPGGDRPPYPPRGDRPYGDQRPGPPRGPRPGGDRPPYPPRGDRPYGDQRPGPPRGPRPGGDRPPYPPRGDRPDGQQQGRRPYEPRPQQPPRGPRPGWQGGAPRPPRPRDDQRPGPPRWQRPDWQRGAPPDGPQPPRNPRPDEGGEG